MPAVDLIYIQLVPEITIDNPNATFTPKVSQ